jgi:hypothetical protein
MRMKEHARRTSIEMRKMKMSKCGLLIVVFVLTLFAGSRSARADGVTPCQTVSVASILGTSCSIGNATYQFSSSAWTGSLAAGDVLFTPDDSTADSPGFILSPNGSAGPVFTLTGGSAAVEDDPANLTYTASITNPSPGETIIGLTGRERQEAVSVVNGDGVARIISMMSFPAPCFNTQFLVTGFDFVGTGSGSFDTFFRTSNLVQGNPGCSEVTQTTVDAEILLHAQNATTSLGSGGFYFNETGVPDATMTSATPEPSSLILMVSGLLGLAGVVHSRLPT